MPSSGGFLKRLIAEILGVRPAEDSIDWYQRQSFALAVLLMFTAVSVFAVVFFVLGDTASTIALMLSLAPVSYSIYLMRRNRTPVMSMQIVAASLYVLLCYLSYREGGLVAPALPWLILIPFVLIIGGAYHAALGWLVLDLVAVAGFLVLTLGGHTFPNVLGNHPPVLYALGAMGFFLVTIAWLIMVDTDRRKTAMRLQSANTELVSARDEALAAVSSKSRFLATMSHELRTPMNGVLGMAELMAGGDLSTRQRRYLQTIQTSGEALLSIINDVLDFSRIEAGKLELAPIDFDLAELVQQVCEMFAPQAFGKSIGISCCIEDTVPQQVVADRDRLRQIIMNLVNNAVKFTERGEVRVNVSAQAAVPDGRSQLRIEVRDTGIGFDDEVKRKLFEAFTQADNSTTRKFGGTGLGLSIVRGLLNLMGGQISVESQAGVGSVFSVSLPVEVPLQPPLPPKLFSHGERVLLVEAAPLQREAIQYSLARFGLVVTAVADAAAAVAALESGAQRQELFGLCVVDAAIATASSQLRNNLMQQAIATLYIAPTGATHSLGSDTQILYKPLRPVDLREAVQRALSSSAASRGSERAEALIVGGDPVTQEVLMAALEFAGMPSAVVPDIAAVNASPARFVFLHAGVSAKEDLLALRSRMADAPTVVIAFGGGEASEQQAWIAHGYDGYLSSPFSGEEILSLLRRLQESRPPRPVGAGEAAVAQHVTNTSRGE